METAIESRRRLWLRRLDALFWICAAGGSVLVASAVLAFGLQFSRVLSGSMEPGIHVGDVVVTRSVDTASLRLGDVVSLTVPGSGAPYIHRIVGLRLGDSGAIIHTRGDANPEPDPWRVVWQQPKAQVLVAVLETQRITDVALRLQPIALPLFLLGILSTALFAWQAMRKD